VPGHAFEIPLDLGVTSTGGRAWHVRVFDPFDLWVKERKQPVEVTAAGAGKRRLHYLDALLRHRPFSIAPWSPGHQDRRFQELLQFPSGCLALPPLTIGISRR
jgi:hypothetical protein